MLHDAHPGRGNPPADQLSADAITDADAKLHQARFSAEARAAATPNAAGWSPTLR